MGLLGQVSLCGIGWPWNSNPTMSVDLSTSSHFHRCEWGVASVFVSPEQPGSVFLESCPKSVIFLIMIFMEYKDSTLLWSHHVGDWVSTLWVIPWAVPCLVSPTLSQQHFRLPLLCSLSDSLIPSLCVLFLIAGDSQSPKTLCHRYLNHRWLLNASCVLKGSSVISLSNPLIVYKSLFNTVWKALWRSQNNYQR